MAEQGQQQAMTQEELDRALWEACGEVNDLACVEDMLGRGADQHAHLDDDDDGDGLFIHDGWGSHDGWNSHDEWNSLHLAAYWGNEQIVTLLLSKGAVLEARTSHFGETALYLAACNDESKICLLLIAKGADLRARSNNNYSVLSFCRYNPFLRTDPRAELKAAFRAGCHPSQVQRRKDENWAKRWPLMEVATGCGFLLMAAKKAELKATALPTDVALPPLPTATEEQRRALRHSKVLGNIGLVRRIASFIQDKEPGEEDEDPLDEITEKENRRK